MKSLYKKTNLFSTNIFSVSLLELYRLDSLGPHIECPFPFVAHVIEPSRGMRQNALI